MIDQQGAHQLKQYSSPDERAYQSDLSAVAFGHGETILLADCNANLLKLGSSLLKKLNYQVVTAVDENQVIKQFVASGKKIDLLILDTEIPRSHGKDIMDKINSYQPQVKALFYTVCDSLIDSDCRKIIGQSPVITKPYSISEFSRMIYQTLH